MRALSRAGAGHPLVVQTAQGVVRGVAEKSPGADVSAMLGFVRGQMRYTHDPRDTETIKAPWVLLEEASANGAWVGDCDDATTLLAALLGAVGYATQFAVVGTDSSRPREASHVFMQVHTPQGWVTLDPIVREFGVGEGVPAEHIVGTTGVYPATSSGHPEAEMRMRGLGAEEASWDQIRGAYNTGDARSSSSGGGLLDSIGGAISSIFGGVTKGASDFYKTDLGRDLARQKLGLRPPRPLPMVAQAVTPAEKIRISFFYLYDPNTGKNEADVPRMAAAAAAVAIGVFLLKKKG